MEESLPSTNSDHDRSAQTGETLRKLREQADQTLDSHRRRLTNIESELNLHFQQITEELARDRVVDEMETEASQNLQQEFQHCREMLAQAEGDLGGLRQVAESTSAQLEERTEELQQLDEQFQQIENEQAELLGERDQLQEALSQANAESESLRAQLSGEAVDHEARLAELTAKCERLCQQDKMGQAERDRLTGKLDQLQETLSQTQSQSETLQGQLSALAKQRDAELAQCTDDLEQLQQQFEETQSERDRLAEQLEQLREKNDETHGECARLQSELETAGPVQDELHAVREEMGTLQQQYQAAQHALDTAEDNHEKCAEQLRDAEQQILELESDHGVDEQLDQLQRKFDLALADVDKLKRENANLHEEVLRRPEADEKESPELVSLRAERDGLASRVEELEKTPSSESSVENQQELADLQRRFELAVEDVRQLKQDNVLLQEKLNRAPQADAAMVDNDAPLDWQAQKAILLAELEAEENGDIASQRREARTTIEGTISITDRVVAEKDIEIQQLQKLLDSRPTGAPIAETQPDPHAELFDQDELIQAERARLEEARKKVEEKLRKAEIEISVQRATLAREQAAVEEKMSHLPKEEVPDEQVEASAGKPRRRWLSALGLKEEDEA